MIPQQYVARFLHCMKHLQEMHETTIIRSFTVQLQQRASSRSLRQWSWENLLPECVLRLSQTWQTSSLRSTSPTSKHQALCQSGHAVTEKAELAQGSSGLAGPLLVPEKLTFRIGVPRALFRSTEEHVQGGSGGLRFRQRVVRQLQEIHHGACQLSMFRGKSNGSHGSLDRTRRGWRQAGHV